jgi:uncharacterized membrane protein
MSDTEDMDEQEYRERLAHDISAWTHGELITPEQERAILARIGAGERRAVGALRLGWFVTAISIIGALVLAGGVVLLFASQWDTMPTWFRTGSLLAGMLAAYAAGYALIYRFEMQRVGSALLLLGALLYEAGLFLLVQIYNMPVDSPILLLFAAAGILPLAYLFESRIVLLLGLANVTAWVIFEMVRRYPDSPKTQSALLVVAALGVALYAIGHLHALRRATAAFADVYSISGLLVVLGLVYAFTFDEPWSAMIDAGVKSYASPPVVYASIGVAAALVAVQAWLRARDAETGIDVAAQAVVLATAATVATWPASTGYSLLFNAVYFAISAGLVTRGYLRGDERYINLGLAIVGLGLFTRYIDVFWSTLARSAFFIIGGVLLLAVAFAIERMRRGLIRGMAAPRDDSGGAPGATGVPA